MGNGHDKLMITRHGWRVFYVKVVSPATSELIVFVSFSCFVFRLCFLLSLVLLYLWFLLMI